jgi:hypothetical protein
VKADFRYAQCQGANFVDAQCQGADFGYAQCRDFFYILAHWFLNEYVNRGFVQFAGDISPPPVPIHARHKLRLCALKFHLILIN